MRIAVAEFVQEIGSFSPMLADLRDFEGYGLFFGDEIFQRMPDAGPFGGFREVAAAERADATVLPLIRAWGGAGGVIRDETAEFLRTRFRDELRRALPVDALFLSLHGAAASESDDDLEGRFLADARELVGPNVPIVVAVDHHANITAKMMQHADALIGHETQPHDPKATGRKAARVLFRQLKGQIRLTRAWRKIPMITPQDQFLTERGPMKEWFDLARSYERQPGVVDVSPYPMQPWLDVAEGGWSVVVHTDDDERLADEIAADMARAAWRLRDEFWRSERLPTADAVRTALHADQGLVLVSDTGDSVYGGAPGDSTTILAELLRQRPAATALVPLVDRAAVDAAFQAGVGGGFSRDVGAVVDQTFFRPVTVDGRVAALSRGVTLHLPDRGVCDIGRAALVEVGGVKIVLLEDRTFAINHPVLYTHLGLDPADARLVVLKTASNFQFFQKWRRGLIRVDTPGATQSDLTTLPWKKLPRPIYPLDQSTAPPSDTPPG